MNSIPPAPASSSNIPNYLVWTIVTTVLATCFCCPLGLVGIVGIVFSAQVNTKLQMGDEAGAMSASKNAKLFCIIAAALAAIGLIINIIVMATHGGMEGYMQYIQQMQSR